MWSRVASRDVLISRRGTAAELPLFGQQEDLPTRGIPRGEIWIAWSERPPEDNVLPELIVVPHGELPEFLAWSATYLPTVSPLTAFCRVADEHCAKTLAPTSRPSLKVASRGAAAAVVGEALSELGSVGTDIAVSGCLSTFSFVAARAIAFDLDADLTHLASKWNKALSTLGLGRRHVQVEDVLGLWEVVAALEGKRSSSADSGLDDICAACRELMRQGSVAASTWQRLAERTHVDLPTDGSMRGRTAEERVVAVEEALARVLSKMRGRGDPAYAFVSALLLNSVAPGSMGHMEMAQHVARAVPGVVAWYGLCAGLTADSDVLDRAEGLGRWVLRELLREESLVARPRCDISIDELEVRARDVRSVNESLRSETSGAWRIEFAPRVAGLLRRSSTGAPKSPNRLPFDPIDVESIRELAGQLRSLRDAAGRASALCQDLLPEGSDEDERSPRAGGRRKKR